MPCLDVADFAAFASTSRECRACAAVLASKAVARAGAVGTPSDGESAFAAARCDETPHTPFHMPRVCCTISCTPLIKELCRRLTQWPGIEQRFHQLICNRSKSLPCFSTFPPHTDFNRAGATKDALIIRGVNFPTSLDLFLNRSSITVKTLASLLPLFSEWCALHRSQGCFPSSLAGLLLRIATVLGRLLAK